MKTKALVLLLVAMSLALVLFIIFERDSFIPYRDGKSANLFVPLNSPSVITAFWLNSDLIAYQDISGHLYTLSIKSREVTNIALPVQRNDYIAGYREIEKNQREIVICSYRNLIITKPDQVATEITVSSISNRSEPYHRQLEFSQTVKPLECSTGTIRAIDNFPGSPERQYQIDVSKTTITRYESTAIQPKVVTEITLNRTGYKLLTPIYNPLLIYSPDNHKIAIIDNEKKLYLFAP